MSIEYRPDVVGRIEFFPLEKGGRFIKSAIKMNLFPTSMEYEEHLWDVKLFLEGQLPVAPGDVREIPMWTWPTMPPLDVGDNFRLVGTSKQTSGLHAYASGSIIKIIERRPLEWSSGNRPDSAGEISPDGQ